jgi:hypothetical protein
LEELYSSLLLAWFLNIFALATMFWRTTPTGPTDAHAALIYSPGDVLIEIAKSLDSLSDVLSFALTVGL